MALNIDLVSQFAKLTANKKETKKESTAWGEVVEITESGKCFVKLDGSDRVTPVDTITEAKVGDRVSVTIKNHAATLTGNTSSPSINADGSTVGGIRTDFKNLSADNLLIREKLTASEGYIAELTAKNVKIEETLEAHTGKFENLEADVAEFGRLSATFATFDALNAKDAEIRNLLADYATITRLNADRAEINELLAGKATIADLTAVQGTIGLLDAGIADIKTLIFGTASGTSIHTNFANAVIAQLGDAQIKSAMIESISAGKITAGDIITNNVKVKSEDGKLLIADQTIQISDNTRVRVQIGKDAANDYSINIWDADGKLMFSEGGLTEDAVKEQIIRNDMVKDDANISASKLDIDTLFNVINNDGSHTLKSNKIKLDEENQTLDVAFGALTTKVDGQSETISSQGTAISVIQGNISSKIWQQDITTAINDISIGGTNLIKNSKNPSDASHWTRGNVIKDDELNENVFYMTNSAAGETTAGTHRIKVTGGEWYTVSALVKRTANVKNIDFFFLSRKESDTTDFVYIQNKINMSPEAGKWVRLTWTFQMYSEAEEGYLRIDHNGSADGSESTLYYTNVKVEKGQKATDWSPSPEDMASVATLNTKYSEINQTLDGIETTVGLHTTEIDGLVTAVSDVKSSIKQTFDSITMTVESISIGGRNLIASTSLDTVYSGVNKDVWSAKTIGIPTGNEYVVSFDAKADANLEISCFFYSPNTTLTSESSTGDKRTNVTDGHSKVAITTEWKRYWVKWTQNGSATTSIKNVIVGRNASTTNKVYIRAVKLEAGNKATDWSPAPEDAVTYTNSQIEQLADNISLSVTSSAGSKAGISITANGSTKSADLPVREAFENDPTAINISAGTVTFSSNTFIVDSTYFKVTSDGTITASGGTIGGFAFTGSGFYDKGTDANGLLFGLSFHSTAYASVLWLGGTNDRAPFRVTKTGKLYASDAVIKGDITTESGLEKAELTSGKLTFYHNGEKQGLISSKYHPNATDYGLTLRLPSNTENQLTKLTFVHEVGTEGSGYVVDYTMHNMPSDGVSGAYGGDMENARHYFRGGMRVIGGMHVSGQLYASGMIYLRNMCAIGWYDNNEQGPRQLLSFDDDNVFTIGNNSYWTDAHKLTLPNGDSKGLFIKNADASTRLRILEVNSSNALSIGYGLYAKNADGYSTSIYASDKIKLFIRGEGIVFEKSSNSTYSAFLMPSNSGKCTLGSANYRFYRLYAANACDTTSDRRLKENIKGLSDIHSELFDRLTPVEYNLIDGDGQIHYGLIAQDVIAAMNELGMDEQTLDLVQHHYDVNEETGELNDTYGLVYNHFISMLIHEVQKLKRKIKILEGE